MQDSAFAAAPSRPHTSEDDRNVGRPASRPRRRGRVVLLAEDDPIVRHVIRLLLELQGDTVIEATDGADAVTRAEAHEGRLDLLLTDVMMPGLNGAEACARIRERRPELPTLFISGYYPDAVFPDQRLPGRSAFLAKPFMPEDLGEALERLLGEGVRGTRSRGAGV
jgi:two-component system, cell cycle sensor histidine kinase and response regulator CckA